MEKCNNYVLLYTQEQYQAINCGLNDTCEDICRELCKKNGFKPLSNALFSLRGKNTGFFLSPYSLIEPNEHYEFRIRYKLANLTTIKSLDKEAFNYLYHQTKYDLKNNMIPELEYPNHKKKVVGLGVASMLVDMIERKMSAADCEKYCKNYLPAKHLKKHKWFLKTVVSNELKEIENINCDVSLLKSSFIETVMSLAPNYLLERYTASASYSDGNHATDLMRPVEMEFSPYDKEHPGLSVHYLERRKCQHIGRPQDIYTIIIEGDVAKIEVRDYSSVFKVEIPDPCKMESFVSCIAGYYRLMVKWTVDICLNFPTPSLKRLRKIDCHGPIGGEYSYNKLQERQCIAGTYIVRQCEKVFDDYYIDIIINGNSIETYRLTNQCEMWQLHSHDSSISTFSSLKELGNSISAEVKYKLQLVPSEYDKPQLLLLCLPYDKLTPKKNLSQCNESEMRLKAPQIFHLAKDLRAYINSKKQIENGTMVEMRADWLLSDDAKLEVTMRTLNSDKYLSEFMRLTDKWSQLNSPALIKMYGFSTTSPYSYVIESIKLGSLNEFLRSAQKELVANVCLIDAAYTLARALLYLQEQNLVHGRIRCKSLYVVRFDAPNSLMVRLGDSGFQKSYINSELPWIPFEYHSNPNRARTDFKAEIWAYATTIWEIFSRGEMPLLQYFITGKCRPLKPKDCPGEIYKIMRQGWNLDPVNRPSLQEIFVKLALGRDANYGAFSKISNMIFSKNMNLKSGDAALDTKNETTYCAAFDTQSIDSESSINSDVSDSFNIPERFLLSPGHTGKTILSDDCNPENCESVFEDYNGDNVIVQGQIGFGDYGCVYRGLYEQHNIVKEVAIKRLKASPSHEILNDFQREIRIMKTLTHPNIVQIITWIEQPHLSIVMEFVRHRSFLMYLTSNPTLNIRNLLKFAKDIAIGMEYLASKQIVHRDLAARNILVDNDECIKISDFGLAQMTDTNGYYVMQNERYIPIRWYAPESLRHNKYSHYSDVWSYGVTLFEIFSRGQEPNLIPKQKTGLIDLLEALESGKRLSKPENCPESLYQKLLMKCWCENPKERPDFTDILQIVDHFINEYSCEANQS